MPALRLILLAVIVIGVLSVVVALAPPVPKDGNDRPVGAPPTDSAMKSAPAIDGQVRSATTPRKEPLDARVGDTIALKVKPKAFDILAAPSLGVRRILAGGETTVVQFSAARAGTFKVRLTQSGRTIARIRIRPDTGGKRPADPAPSAPDEPSGVTPTPATILPLGIG